MEKSEVPVMTSMIVITRGPLKIEVPRSELISVDPTADGIAFAFKGGSNYILTEPNMPPLVKNSIKMIVNQTKGKVVTINLLNFKNPVSIEA